MFVCPDDPPSFFFFVPPLSDPECPSCDEPLKDEDGGDESEVCIECVDMSYCMLVVDQALSVFASASSLVVPLSWAIQMWKDRPICN